MRVEKEYQPSRLRGAPLISSLIAAVIWSVVAAGAPDRIQSQDQYPSPPSDRTLIYVADEKNALTALPFETATTPLRIGEVARGDKISYLELKGEHAATTLQSDTPRFYLFIKDEQGVRPPFIVQLTNKRNARRVGATTQKGLGGFGVPSEEIVKPRLLVLKREDGMLFMEVRPRYMLAPGEYAFVGADLQRIATFRIVDTVNR